MMDYGVIGTRLDALYARRRELERAAAARFDRRRSTATHGRPTNAMCGGCSRRPFTSSIESVPARVRPPSLLCVEFHPAAAIRPPEWDGSVDESVHPGRGIGSGRVNAAAGEF